VWQLPKANTADQLILKVGKSYSLSAIHAGYLLKTRYTIQSTPFFAMRVVRVDEPMKDKKNVIFVAPGPGKSGADTTLRVLGCHPDIATPIALGPALVGAVLRLLVHAPYDQDAWLPRRAAQAFADVCRRLRLLGPFGERAAKTLEDSANVIFIDIPVYGHLAMPAPMPASTWRVLIRQIFLDAIDTTERQYVALKLGPYCTGLVATLLDSGDVFLHVVRHPVESVITLTEPVIDGMRPLEAIDYVSLSLRHTQHVINMAASKNQTVKLEDLISSPDKVLAKLKHILRLSEHQEWQAMSARCLPQGIQCEPRWDHPHICGYRQELAALAQELRYQ